jgi:hypothetical protein
VRLSLGCATTLLAFSGLAGCRQGSQQILPITSDSAGTRIVTYGAAALTAAPRWSLSSLPVLDIGGSGAQGTEELFQVRSVAALSGGRLLVANAGTLEMRIFDSTGALLQTIGRRGSGPGEFQSLLWAAVGPGDSLWAYDFQLQRVTIFDAAGRVGRSFVLDIPEVRLPWARVLLHDGSLLVTPDVVHTPAAARGVHRDTTVFYRVGPAGRVLGAFQRVPGQDVYVEPEGGGVRSVPLGFGRSLVFAAGDSLVFVAGTDQYEVRGLSSDGALRLVIRADRAPLPVTPDLIAAFKLRQLSRIEGERWRQFFTHMYDAMPYPASQPVLSALCVDHTGALWIRDYPPHPDSTALWRIFGPTGTLQGTVQVPPGFELLGINGHRVFGLWRDEDDLEHVRAYLLRRRT